MNEYLYLMLCSTRLNIKMFSICLTGQIFKVYVYMLQLKLDPIEPFFLRVSGELIIIFFTY